jgi:hypothetical protein
LFVILSDEVAAVMFIEGMSGGGAAMAKKKYTSTPLCYLFD